MRTKLNRQWYRDQGMMMQHKDEFKSYMTFQDVAKAAYAQAIEDIEGSVSELLDEEREQAGCSESEGRDDAYCFFLRKIQDITKENTG